jgi:2-dehydro-3-deoxyphosphooctonate aldolase (KDO 8-P synthase)
MFDATHSVQIPGGLGNSSGGDRRFALPLCRAALGIGADALFMEVHPSPDEAVSDGRNMIPLDAMPRVLEEIAAFDKLSRERGFASLDWL